MKKNNHHREILALTLIRNLGSRRVGELLKHFQSPADIFSGDVRKLRQMEGVGRTLAAAVATFDDWQQVDQILRRTERAGAELVAITDPSYPPLLRQIYDPPFLLWVKGDPAALSKPGLAVVGTRRADRYGKSQAERWSSQLTDAGLAVFSGLAYGIDTISHRSALKRGGTTAAIFGSGIDRIYPARNSALVQQIIQSGGAVATELAPGSPPIPGNFPVRNRIVSGMSLGVLVVQSAMKGGSMITARTALDQNREVFIIPHNLGQKSGEGNNYLIQSGQGKLVQSLEDILVELSLEGHISGLESGKQQTGEVMDLSPVKREICSILSEGWLQIDDLADKTGTPTFELLPLLLELEMDGVVLQRAGKYFGLK